MRYYYLALSLTLLIYGCASTGEIANPPAYELIRPGSTLQLKETLAIPEQLARVYFQYGKVVPKKSINRYDPSCNLLSYVVLGQEQIIHPDEFKVLQVSNKTELVQAEPILLASNKVYGGSLLRDRDGPMAEVFYITLEIRSDKNPDIKRFECEAWRNLPLGKHLSLEEIQQALGNIIDIKLSE